MFKNTIKHLCLFIVVFFSQVNAGNLADAPLVTIHGFLGAPWNLYYFTHHFEKLDMHVIPYGYESTEKKIEEHAQDLVECLQMIALESPGEPINFITHSMGGLVLRSAINKPNCPIEAKIGKAVLLGPPNQGACWGRILEQFAIARAIAKDEAGQQLMTEEDFAFLGNFPDTMKVMVIAGNLSFNPFLEGESDGFVKVDETFLTTPHQHEVINATHTSMLLSKRASKLAQSFFQED